MKPYVKVYLDSFSYDETDYVPCECCMTNEAVDIHHIISRKRDKGLFLDIRNLMALCRDCHQRYGEINYLIPKLFEIHSNIMRLKGLFVDFNWFNGMKEKYGDSD